MRAADQLTARDFAPLVGKVAQPIGNGIKLTLVALDQHAPAGWEGMARQPFSLILRGPRQPVLPEGPYELMIDGNSTPALYVIPIFTAASRHQDYQIIFN